MKKIISLLVCAVCFISVGAFLGCQDQNQEQAHVCSWSDTVLYNEYCHYQECLDSSCELINVLSNHEWDTATLYHNQDNHYYKCADKNCGQISGIVPHNYVLDVQSSDGSVQNLKAIKTCTECAYSFVKEDIDTLAVTTFTVDDAINNLYTDTIIILNRGNYGTIKLSSKSNVIICAKEGVTVELLLINGGCENICVYGVNFDKQAIDANYAKAGIKMEGTDLAVENLLVKNCTFTNDTGIITDTATSTANVRVEDSKFLNVRWCNRNGHRSAIVLYSVRGLTVKGCEFNVVKYNAIQAYAAGGSDLIIKDNVFKDIGSRVLILAVGSDKSFMDISGNTFYKENVTSSDDAGKLMGAYIYSMNKTVRVGVNTWEVMPENTKVYLDNVSIDMSVQELLNK